jgi:hypothetical protein
MPARHGAANCVPKCGVGGVPVVAFLRPPRVTSDLFGLACSSYRYP